MLDMLIWVVGENKLESDGKPSFEELLESTYQEARRNPFPVVDGIATIGHSVSADSSNGSLSRMAQTVVDTGEMFPDGRRKFIRTAKTEGQMTLTELLNAPDTIIGGGEAVMRAVVELCKKRQPKVLIHSGGRPKYLEIAADRRPELTEALIMKRSIEKQLGTGIRQVLKENGKNTIDDMKAILEAAREQGCRTIGLVALTLRFPRCLEALSQVKIKYPEYKDIEVIPLPAEVVISAAAGEHWNAFWDKYRQSKSYQKTLEDEKGGFVAMRANEYHGSGQT